MNKQKKRAISRGKFDRACEMSRMGMRVNAFTALDSGCGHISAYVVNGFMYWAEYPLVSWPNKPVTKYFRKSISEALK
jgi:hypothetical protein